MKLMFGGIFLFSKISKDLMIEHIKEAGSLWPILLFTAPIGRGMFLFLQKTVSKVLHSSGSPVDN